MGNIRTKWISLLLIFALCAGMIPGAVAAEPAATGAAFGEAAEGGATAETRGAWTNDALSADAVKTLINSQTLYPQRTGWDKLDALLENLLSKAGGQDAYTKLLYIYNWLVQNVTYSWEGYSYTVSSVTSYNSFTNYNYLQAMTYEEGLTKSIPDDMANRAYHVFAAKKGVCYDYAIALAVAARYIGIESYVRTGYFVFEDTQNGTGHHGWTILMLGGETYIFDSQRDARNWQYYQRSGYYFGVAKDKTYRYYPDYSWEDSAANAARDAQMLPMTADRGEGTRYTVDVTVEGEGTVIGAGSYKKGETVTLTAVPAAGYRLVGWYGATGTLLSANEAISFVMSDDYRLTVKYEKAENPGSYPEVDVTGGGSLENFKKLNEYTQGQFTDVPAGQWYTAYVASAYELGLMKGSDDGTFGIFDHLYLNQTLAIACRLHNIYYGGSGEFVQGEPWYQIYVDYALKYGIMTPGQYDPTAEASRAQFAAIINAAFPAEALQPINQITAIPDLDESDPGYAGVLRLYNAGILQGTDDQGSFTPDNPISRSEVVAMATRLAVPSQRVKAKTQAGKLLESARKVGEISQEAQTALDRYLTEHWEADYAAVYTDWALLAGSDGSVWLRCYSPMDSDGKGEFICFVYRGGVVTSIDGGPYTQESARAFEEEVAGRSGTEEGGADPVITDNED